MVGCAGWVGEEVGVEGGCLIFFCPQWTEYRPLWAIKEIDMILPDWKIREWAEAGGISPYMVEHVNPASIDLRLGAGVIWLGAGANGGDERWELGGQALEIVPGMAILATTMEYIRLPADVAGAVYLKSSMARMGLDHALAGWVDPGFCGELTLEFHAHKRVRLYEGQRVCQLVLMKLCGRADRPYGSEGLGSRYQGQRGPTKARKYVVNGGSDE